MKKQDGKPECSECGATVPYEPSPKFGYGISVDGEPMAYCCNEECLIKYVKGMKDGPTIESILRDESERN